MSTFLGIHESSPTTNDKENVQCFISSFHAKFAKVKDTFMKYISIYAEYSQEIEKTLYLTISVIHYNITIYHNITLIHTHS